MKLFQILLIFVAVRSHTLTLEEIDFKIRETDAQLLAIKNLNEYKSKMSVPLLTNSDIEETLSVVQGASRQHYRKLQPDVQYGIKLKSLVNNIFERSVIETNFSVMGVTPIKTFKTIFGSVSSYLTIVAQVGTVNAYTADGDLMSTLELNIGTPIQVIRATHGNEMSFGLISETAVVLLKFAFDPQTRNLVMMTEWQTNFSDLNITDSVISAVASRQKGKYRISILDSSKTLTSINKDGQFEERSKLDTDTLLIKNTPNALAIQIKQKIVFKKFQIVNEETMTNCIASSKIVDFQFDTNGNVYVLSDSSYLTVFNMNQVKQTCNIVGKLKLIKNASKVFVSGALLILLSEDGSVQLLRIKVDFKDVFDQEVTLINSLSELNGQNIQIQNILEQADSIDEYLVVGRIKEQSQTIATFQSTLRLPLPEPTLYDSFVSLIPQLIFLIVLLGLGWWQYKKIIKEREKLMEEKVKKLEKETEKKQTLLGQTAVKTTNSKANRNSDDSDSQFIQKNRQVAGMEKAASQKQDIEKLKSQIKQMEDQFGGQVDGMLGQLTHLKNKTGNIEKVQSQLRQTSGQLKSGQTYSQLRSDSD